MLTQDLLHELFEYRDGLLYWKVSRGTRARIGCAAGSLNGAGYLHTELNNKKYKNHRLIFLMHHGYLPKFLDHIDGCRTNNKIENLRPATLAENNCNRKLHHNNLSGCPGVYWHKQTMKWRVKVRCFGKQKHIGCYTTLEKAIEVSNSIRKEQHGNFYKEKPTENLSE